MDSGDVAAAAGEMCYLLGPACERIAIAGSLRRGKADVKDIEIVAIPKLSADLFGSAADGPTELDALIARLVKANTLDWDMTLKRNGPRYKRLIWVALGIPVDLFLADADNWGNILAIRTGDADFSRALVTSREVGGLMPSFLAHKDGGLWEKAVVTQRGAEKPFSHADAKRIACPTEEDYFAALGLPCLLPDERNIVSVNKIKLGLALAGRHHEPA